MTATMWIALAALFLSNVGLVIGATWRLSGVISKVVEHLVSIEKLMDLNNKHTEQRILSVETRTNLQDQTILDIQRRQTAMELEMKLTMKKGE
jgi:hypothetical protein